MREIESERERGGVYHSPFWEGERERGRGRDRGWGRGGRRERERGKIEGGREGE